MHCGAGAVPAVPGAVCSRARAVCVTDENVVGVGYLFEFTRPLDTDLAAHVATHSGTGHRQMPKGRTPGTEPGVSSVHPGVCRLTSWSASTSSTTRCAPVPAIYPHLCTARLQSLLQSWLHGSILVMNYNACNMYYKACKAMIYYKIVMRGL